MVFFFFLGPAPYCSVEGGANHPLLLTFRFFLINFLIDLFIYSPLAVDDRIFAFRLGQTVQADEAVYTASICLPEPFVLHVLRSGKETCTRK